MCNSLAILHDFCVAIFACSPVITLKLSKQYSIFEEKVYTVRGGIQSLFALKWKKIVSISTLHVCVSHL